MNDTIINYCYNCHIKNCEWAGSGSYLNALCNSYTRGISNNLSMYSIEEYSQSDEEAERLWREVMFVENT